MTESEVREIFIQARSETSAKEAQLTWVIEQDSGWVLLFLSRGEELAISVPKEAAVTPEGMKSEIKRSLMRLS